MARSKPTRPQFRGDLQADIMSAVWRLGEAKVEDIRSLQPERGRPAYNTVQTVMTRLVDRGLLTRKRRGNAYLYRARYEEADYLAGSIGDRLAGASPRARREALLSLVEQLDPGELDELAAAARRLRRLRTETDA